MLTGNESYIIMKLSTGEQIMGILEQEDSTHVQILDPMIIRTIPVPSEGREHVTAHPYCQWTGDNVFDIAKQNVIFIKPLLKNMIPHYLRIVKEHESGPALQTRKRAEDLDWGDGGEITREEAIKRIQMLEGITGIVAPEIEEEEELSYFVEGNDTKH
jgi:hypothetical protein